MSSIIWVIGEALSEVLGICLIVAAGLLVIALCALLILIFGLSVVYWLGYASNKKRWPYDRKSTEILWVHVIAASAAITMMLLFAFWRIADAAGYYFLSVWTPIVGYYAIAFIIATCLHRYWTYGEVFKAEMYTAATAPAQEAQQKAGEITTGEPTAPEIIEMDSTSAN